MIAFRGAGGKNAAMFAALYRRYPFPPIVWYMIVETALSRTAFFMVMPFVALRMYGQGDHSMTLIGAVIGFGPLVALVIGFYVGHLSDLWGRQRLLVIGMSLWVLVFLGFAYANHPLEFAILVALNGLARGMFDPVSTALVSDLCTRADPSGALQKGAFHLRYYAINVGCAMGPVVGARLATTRPALGFTIAAGVYAAAAMTFVFLARKWKLRESEREQTLATHRFSDAVKVISKDRRLQLYLAAYACITLALAQMETTFALHLKDFFGGAGTILFGNLLAVNGLIVVALTLSILAWTKRFDLNLSCAISAMIWAVGFLALGFSVVPWHFYAAMFLLSLGEIVVFANGNLIIESLAPKKMKGAYLGCINLSHGGFVVGPLVGGWLLESGGGILLFSVMALFLWIAALLYLWARKQQR